MDKATLLTQLHNLNVVVHQQTTLRSGEISDYYCDMRRVFAAPAVLKALAATIVGVLPSSATCIAASGYGGLPLGAVVAILAHLPFVGVRGEPKDHGTAGRLAGYIPTAHDKIVIVDDVLTSGSSIRETVSGLVSSKATVVAAVVLVRRNEVSFPFPVQALFEIDELLQ